LPKLTFADKNRYKLHNFLCYFFSGFMLPSSIPLVIVDGFFFQRGASKGKTYSGQGSSTAELG